MEQLKLQALILALSIITLFISKEEYTRKVAAIGKENAKPVDLKGWLSKTVISPKTGMKHHWYSFSCAKPDAPAIVFLHGLNLDARTFLNLKSLSADYNLIAYDFPETSSSYKDSIDDFVFLVNDFTEQLNLEQFYLAGVSFGGVVACRYAATHLSSVKKLILISTFMVGYSPEDNKKNKLIHEFATKTPDYKFYWFLEHSVNKFLKKHPGVDFCGMLGIKQLAYYRQVTGSIQAYNEPSDIHKLTQPVLILLGSQDDQVNTAQESIRFRKEIPRADLQIINNGEHAMAFLNSNDIATRIDKFLKQLHAESSAYN